MDKIVIVFQMGKVGSTSLVSALNTLPDVTAYQCHFLGKESYFAMIQNFLEGDFSDYFIDHGIGQVAQNIKAERALLSHEKNGNPTYIISMSREPIDWYRSALAQDLRGTIDGILSLAAWLEQEDRPIACLASVLLPEIKRILSAELPDWFGQIDLSGIDTAYPQHANLIRQQLSIFFRPFYWFEEHFMGYTGKTVTLNEEGVYLSTEAHRNYLVMRYEDLDRIPQIIQRHWGLTLPALENRNVSEAKPGAGDVKREIGKWQTDIELNQLLSGTDYCRRLGYHQTE